MTDASHTGPCPACGRAELRDHEGHLVCDDCNALLVGLDDLAAALTELDGVVDRMFARDPQPDAARCPRCGGEMTTTALQRGGHLVPGRYKRCEAHGVWLPRTVMAAGFARAGRRGAGMPQGAGTGAGGAYLDAAPSGSAGGAMRGIRDAFASTAPAIGRYSIPRPRVHTLFVSAFRGHDLTCPRCAGAKLEFEGMRWSCATCSGAFVEDAALAAMVSDVTNAEWKLPAASGKPGERRCPVCATAMIQQDLEATPIDRCAAHGVWFDDDELQATLQHASDPPSGIGGWLRRLFRRSPST